MILNHYEPAATLRFFEDICAIPHVSGDERALADYVENFARERGLFCYRDAVHNVFIRLSAAKGHEDSPAVMLQGHLDMVGEKDADNPHDFAADGLQLRIVEADGEDWVAATGTTLGGDDGIAVAMMLAVLDSPPASHPAIECLFTVSEETGLEGAWAFDPVAAGSVARTIINLDSEDEGVITAGCAGGVRTDIRIAVEVESTADPHSLRKTGSEPDTYEPVCLDACLTVTLAGLPGGHSGVQIHEGHFNAIRLLNLILSGAGRPVTTGEIEVDEGDSRDAIVWRYCSVDGGGKDNAIPREATATICLPSADVGDFCRRMEKFADWYRHLPDVHDADRAFTCTACIPTPAEWPAYRLTDRSHCGVHMILLMLRYGVLAMNPHVEGLVAHSRNLGIIKTVQDDNGKPVSIHLTTSSRAAQGAHLDESQRELDQLARVISLFGKVNVATTHRSRYPGWDYEPHSPLRETWIAMSKRLYGVTPRVEVIHAGLECGILCDKMTEATGVAPDIISVGPAMRDIHTPREMLSISSVERTYRLLTAVLTELA